MNWYKVFYWLTVSDGVKDFFDIFSNIFTWFAVIFFILVIIFTIGKANSIYEEDMENNEDEKKNPTVRSWEFGRKYSFLLFYIMLGLSLLTWIGYVATPTKKDCLMIIAGGTVGNFLQSDSTAKQLPSDLTKYLHLSLQSEIKNLSEDARKELGIKTKEEEYLDKLKTMSKEELINLIASPDSTKNAK